jgi:hypothetical protein
LKQQLQHKALPNNAKIFTADAVSMYTNINPDAAMREISSYLRRHKARFKHVDTKALIAGLDLLMCWNIFQFGDTVWHQITGTAMGIPPAVAWATLFYAIHEDKMFQLSNHLLINYVRYIDNIFGIWIRTQEEFQEYITFMNTFHELEWKFSTLVTKVDFLDITINLNNNKLSTTLFETEMNLYLYIPPGSAHPPRVLPGLIFGNIIRIYILCTDTDDKHFKLRQFYHCLISR